MLIFTGLLYQFCDLIEVEFLPFYAWTGLWLALFMIVQVICRFSRTIAGSDEGARERE